MVHRAPDSRLLSNLLQHEKEYTKQLLTLLDTSNASLTSLAAYASASPQPSSQVIMAITGSLAAADDALRRYAHSVELWRETMARLKDMEDEVGNVIRDREILVTRLIKASKSSKPGSGISVRSSSSLSLSNNQDPPSSRPLSLAFSTSSKLSAAQSELQGCELHLAAKERELATSRSAALREGLGARLKALVDCGWVWGELGKEGLRSLEALQIDSLAGDSGQNPKGTDTDSFFVNASSESGMSSICPSQSASQINHERNDTRPPIFHSFRSSEVIEAPPLTAELSTTTVRPLSMATTNTTTGTLSGSGTSTPAHAALLAATTSTLTYAPAVAVHFPPSSPPSAVGVASESHGKENETEIRTRSEVHLPIPPPHALGAEYFNIPLAEMVDVVNARLGDAAGNGNSSPSKSSLHDEANKRVEEPRVVNLVEKRITEEGIFKGDGDIAHNVQGENMHEGTSQTAELPMDEPVQEQNTGEDTEKEGSRDHRNRIQDPESSSDEVPVAKNLEVVENPRFMPEKPRMEAEQKKEEVAGEGERERLPFGSPQLQQTHGGIRPAVDKNAKNSSSSPSKSFFGSLKGFFGSKDKSLPSHSKQKSRGNAGDSSDSDSSSSDGDDWPPSTKKRKLKTLLFRPPDKKTVSAGAKWEPGRGSLDSWNGSSSRLGSGLTGIGGRPMGGKLRAAESPRTTKGDSEGRAAAAVTPSKLGSVDRLELGATGNQGNQKARTRASSDVGTSIAGSQSYSLQGQRQQTARRLKKNRTVAGGVERRGSSGSDLEGGGSLSKMAKPISGLGRPPVAGSAAMAKARWLKDPSSAATSSFDQTAVTERKGNSRRSNSVDIGVASRRRESYVLIDPPHKDVVHGDGEEELSSPTPSSSKGQIIDLGERRGWEEDRGADGTLPKDDKSSNSPALRSVVNGTRKSPSRSSSLTSQRKVATVLTVHSKEEGPAVPSDRRLSKDSLSKGGNDIGKMRRTDTLGQSSFNSAGARIPTSSSRPVGSRGHSTTASASIPKSSLGTVISSTSKTTAVPVPVSASLMSIVEDVKRIRDAPQSSSAKPGVMEIVKAPPRTNREDLENFAGHRGAGWEKTEAGSAMFKVQAPGSVFDRKHQTSTGKPGSKGSSATPSPTASALGVGIQQRQLGSGHVIKTPLKSALKNTSRSPSPSPLFMSAPLPLAASASVTKESTAKSGMTHSEAPLSITGIGLADAESAYESGEEEFFTDEGEPSGGLLLANGHAAGAMQSGTTVHTVLPTTSQQSPRKRKSVRVSLKPTFSPPAVEYDEEENDDERTSSSHHVQRPDLPHPPPSTKHKQKSTHGEGKENEKWEDSSDEDDEYKNAKAALSRAARKDKEVSLSVFGQ